MLIFTIYETYFNINLFLSSVFTWGRRMSKKLEQLRRNSDTNSLNNTNAAVPTKNYDSKKNTIDHSKSKNKTERPMSLVEPPVCVKSNVPPPTQKTFKTFFHRIGSTGMLNHRSSQSSTSSSSGAGGKASTLSSPLYRSSSTSQLNTSTSSYVKGDDPTEGVNLKNGASSCNTMHQHAVNGQPLKSSSYDDIASASDPSRKGFPYAFLRSKLSVLPEENGGSVLNQKRMLQNHASNNNCCTSSYPAEPTTPQCNLRRFHYATTASMTSTRDSITQTASPPGISYQNSPVAAIQQQHSSDESSSNVSNSPRTSTSIDWDPMTYQRLSSCLSSNESGYDSDGRHADDSTNSVRVGADLVLVDDSSALLAKTVQDRRSIVIGNSLPAPNMECSGTIRRRFRQIKLTKASVLDSIGVTLSPQYFNINDADVEIRYLVSGIDVNGLAYR